MDDPTPLSSSNKTSKTLSIRQIGDALQKFILQGKNIDSVTTASIFVIFLGEEDNETAPLILSEEGMRSDPLILANKNSSNNSLQVTPPYTSTTTTPKSATARSSRRSSGWSRGQNSPRHNQHLKRLFPKARRLPGLPRSNSLLQKLQRGRRL